MALTAQYEIVPGVKVPVYVRIQRTFGGKREGLGSVVQTFGGATTPEACAKPILPDYNGPQVEWSASDKNEVVVYGALKTLLMADPQYSGVVDC